MNTEPMARLTVHMQGVVPLLMSNGRMADPDNRFAQSLKAGRKKTKAKDESDSVRQDKYLTMWMGALYYDDTTFKINVPGRNLEAALFDEARGNDKKALMSGLWVNEDPELIYDGPKGFKSEADLVSLYEDGFYDLRSAVNRMTGARVMVCRPKFDTWALKVTYEYQTDLLDETTILTYVEKSQRTGICSYTPRFGRFRVVSPDLSVALTPKETKKKTKREAA